MRKAKPFIKWAGGKGQLIEQLEDLLPADFDNWDDVTYIEPFVGGGAMLFYMLQAHPNITHAVINDINPKLTACYEIIRDFPQQLIDSLSNIQEEYYALEDEETKKDFFLRCRTEFNGDIDRLRMSTLFIFLNRTCFNGLYRENKKGDFNVPFGKYLSPTICDADTILADSELLQNVEIMTGDYQQTRLRAYGNTFFYFDPPYRPLSNTSSFNDYTKQPFNDEAQVRLKEFCDMINQDGHTFMLSNSDCLGKDGKDRFFDDLYAEYRIDRVWAKRNVNSIASKRGKLTEILVHNYLKTKKKGLFGDAAFAAEERTRLIV